MIEAVVESLEIKHKLFADVDRYRKPGAVIASNTSGIPIDSIAEPFSDDFKAHFVGIHFFNPPRYMKLVEVIPGSKTSGEVACKPVEIKAIHDAVVVEITLHIGGTCLTEVARQCVEIEAVYFAIMVGIAGEDKKAGDVIRENRIACRVGDGRSSERRGVGSITHIGNA